MDNIKSIFDSMKEFLWDIVGYLVPGIYILILLSTCLTPDYILYPSFGSGANEYLPYVFIIIAYLLGHVTYGFGRVKEKILGSYSYVNQIEDSISKGKQFIIAKELISKGLLAKGIVDDLNNATVRNVRSLAMSFIPEQDHKIYTFTFRSELSNQTGNISIIIGVFGLFFSVFQHIPLTLFITDSKHILLYICLIIAYFFLRQTRNRFYEISISLPFSIYTANAIK